MTVSPVDGKLYVSDHQTLRILRVKTMGPVRDLSRNYEVIAGTGQQCVPGDRQRCGDGRPAVDAKLFYPKGSLTSTHYCTHHPSIRGVTKHRTAHTARGVCGAVFRDTAPRAVARTASRNNYRTA